MVPGKTLHEPCLRPKAWQLEDGFVKVSSIQTYLVTLTLDKSLHVSKIQVPRLYTNGDLWSPSHRIMEKMKWDNLHKYEPWPVLSKTQHHSCSGQQYGLLQLGGWWKAPLRMCGVVEGCSWKGHSGSMNVCRTKEFIQLSTNIP